MTSKTFLAAACVLASALAPTLASAATDAYETKVAVVRTGDLDLRTPEGQSALNARISGAVNRVCGTTAGSIGVEERRAITVCRAKARNAALAVAKTREDQMLAMR